jgi:hypothetical protein
MTPRRCLLLFNPLSPLLSLMSPLESFASIVPDTIDLIGGISDDLYTLSRLGLVGSKLGGKADRWSKYVPLRGPRLSGALQRGDIWFSTTSVMTPDLLLQSFLAVDDPHLALASLGLDALSHTPDSVPGTTSAGARYRAVKRSCWG